MAAASRFQVDIPPLKVPAPVPTINARGHNMRALAQWGRTNARLESCSDLAAPSIASKGYPSAQMREAIASDAVPRKNPRAEV